MCVGDGCRAFYAIDGGKLYEDTKDDYPYNQQYVGEYREMSPDKYELVKELVDAIPEKLFSASSTIIGCPDCGDTGGLYIEVDTAEGKKFWFIDKNKTEVPAYLRSLVDQINAKIDLLQ